MAKRFVFIINLVQDVAIARPIAALARRTFDCAIDFIVTSAFLKRDANGVWMAEIEDLGLRLGVTATIVKDAYDAVQVLQGKGGMLFAASESVLANHQATHEIVRAAPSSFLTVTLQHGLECVGFLHNDAHDAAHGHFVGSGADILVSWFEIDRLYSLKADQRDKIYVAGPPALIDPPQAASAPARTLNGLVCENLHSVRLRGEATADSFLTTFSAFAARIEDLNGSLALRAHPGGRFTEKNNFELPPGVVSNRLPFYKQRLSSFHFGVSAPSSVLLDLAFAGVPAAVWDDGGGRMDLRNYEGLPVVRSVDDWWAFAIEAFTKPEPLRQGQAAYLASLGLPSDVAGRYRRLLALAEG